jgi:hypothetical protein
MRKIFLTAVIIVPLFSLAQFGIKAGVNFANVTNASDINSSSESGFLAGVFLAPPSTGVLGFRTELIFSRQGYNYKTNTNTGTVNLDYILLPQLMQINITKFFPYRQDSRWPSSSMPRQIAVPMGAAAAKQSLWSHDGLL